MGLNLTPSAMAYLVLLLAVASLRIFELRVSRRNQAAMAARGAAKLDKPNFRWVVLVHTGVLIGAAAEALLSGSSGSHVCAFPCFQPAALLGGPCHGPTLERASSGFHEIRDYHDWSFPLCPAS